MKGDGKSNPHESLQGRVRKGKVRGEKKSPPMLRLQKVQVAKLDRGGKWLINYREEAFMRLKSTQGRRKWVQR